MTERAEHTAFTPGPWRIGEIRHAGAYQLVEHSGARGYVCEVQAPIVGDNHDEETREANARLIAAAPDLLAALIRAREAVNAIVLSTHSVSFDADLRAIDAALSRATGEA